MPDKFDPTSYLKTVPTDNDTKAQAWEAFNSSANQQDFEQRMGNINLPKQAKADLWEAKYGSGNVQAPTPPVVQPNKPTPQPPAPTGGQGVLSKLWGWANEPINIGHNRENIAAGEARAVAPPSMADVKQREAHPILGAAYQDTRDFVDSFGTNAAKMLLTPISLGLAAAGPVADAAGAVAKASPAAAPVARAVTTAAKAVGTTAAVGFAGKGIKDQIQQGVLKQPNETYGDYVARTAGNAGMILGGISEGLHLRQKPGIPPAETPVQPQDVATSETPEAEASASVPASKPNGAARVAQAVGNSTRGPQTQTVHVTPDFAQEMSDWNANDELPGKRVMLQGKNKIALAHTDPDSRGFAFTKTDAKPKFSDEPFDGSVPVELSTHTPDGTRGTSAPGHFLSAKIGNQGEAPMPIAEPETEQAATAETPAAEPTEPVQAVAPAISQNETNPIAAKEIPSTAEQVGGVRPGVVSPEGNRPFSTFFGTDQPSPEPTTVALPAVKPVNDTIAPKAKDLFSTSAVDPDDKKKASLPPELAKASPRYGYGTKNFELEFEDPHDLAAYTLGQTKDNKAQAKFIKYLQGEYPDASLQDLKDHSLAVRSAIKDLAKDGDPAQGPLKIPSQGGIETAKAATPAPEEAKPVEAPEAKAAAPEIKASSVSANVKPLEEKIRPLVGQLVQLNRLRIGEAASHAIDKGIEASRSITGDKIDTDTKTALGKMLKEPVGDTLTSEQISKLEKLRGAEGSAEPVLRHASKEEIQRESNKDPEAWQRRLDASMAEMADKIRDPNTPPELAAKLTKALMAEDRDGNPKPWLYERGTLRYPQPEPIEATHPEAPFTTGKLGHSITPITLENLKTALGSQPRDTFFGRTGEKSLVKPDELAEYDRLKDGVTADPSSEPLTKEEELELSRKALIGGNTISDSASVASELLGKADENGTPTGSGSVFSSRGSASREFRAYDRELKQRVLARKIVQTEQALKTQVGEWNKQRNGASTELTQQLAALSDEAKKYLPKEMFDSEKHDQPQASNPSKTTDVEQPAQTARTSKAKSATSKPGSETPFEGIRTNKWDTAINKKYPAESQMLPVLQESIHEKLPIEQRQKMYDRVTQTYHNAIENGNTDALKVALDIAINRGEAGYLDIGSAKGDPLLTPEQNRAINLDSAQRILTRWEAMSTPELLKKKEGLWKNGLTERIEGAAPVENDPIQREEHNELLARHAALKAQVGAPTNVMHSLIDWAQNIADGKNVAERIIRETQGQKNRNVAIQKAIFESADALFESLPSAERDRVWDAMQRGKQANPNLINLMDPKLIRDHEMKYGALPDVNDMLNRVRISMDAARERYAAQSGNLQEFILNYMPGLYENAGRARQLGMEGVGRQPLAGNADFLKQKIYEYQQHAIEEGLQPITNNPIRAGLSMMAQLEHASTAYELRNRFIDSGKALWVPHGETPPPNWMPFNDRLFGERGQGGYYAPSVIADKFNNFVSTGLKGKWLIPNTKFSLYDAIRGSNNIQNLAQLAFSLFHGSDVIANSFLSHLAVAGQRAINEGVFGSRLGKTPVERAQALASSMMEVLKTPAAPILDWAKGRKIEINYHDPVREQKYLQTTADIEAANANVRPDLKFRLEQFDKFKNAWNIAKDADYSNGMRLQAGTKAAFRLASTVPEISSYWLMKSIIPAMKLGALDTAFEQVHREFAGATQDVLNAELQKAADSIDDRFGEMNWDNIFWSRTTKDIAQLFGRAPGWAMGTGRAFKGGIADIPGTVKDIVTGKPVHVSGRTAYIGAMVASTMLFNAVRQFAITGKKPEEPIDYFYPWNGTYNSYGEKNRDYPKFLYTYEAINWYHDPLGTAQHKLAPSFAPISDIAKNQDYYHHQIYDPADSTSDRYAKVFTYMAKNFMPFSVQNAQEASMRGSHSAIASAFGVMPAPQWVGRTKAQNLAYTYYAGDKSTGGKDDDTFERQKNFVQMRSLYQAGQLSPDEIQDAVNSGKLQPKMLKYLFATRTQEPLVTWTKELRSPAQVWNIWQAATTQEKRQLLPTMFGKMAKMTTGDEQTHYFDELEKFANSQDADYQSKLTIEPDEDK